MSDLSEDALDLSYADALDELDDILAHLESSAVDVDVLAERVARGAVLVRYCRQRLRVVRADVDAVVDDLLDDDAVDSMSGRPPPSLNDGFGG